MDPVYLSIPQFNKLSRTYFLFAVYRSSHLFTEQYLYRIIICDENLSQENCDGSHGTAVISSLQHASNNYTWRNGMLSRAGMLAKLQGSTELNTKSKLPFSKLWNYTKSHNLAKTW